MFSNRPWGRWATCVVGVLVLMASTAADAGFVGAQTMANSCPVLTQVVVSPMKASVGDDIDVSAAATDDDGGALTYLWTGTGGSFADPAAQNTTYTCQVAGNQSITVTVSDAEACTATWSTRVTCVE